MKGITPVIDASIPSNFGEKRSSRLKVTAHFSYSRMWLQPHWDFLKQSYSPNVQKVLIKTYFAFKFREYWSNGSKVKVTAVALCLFPRWWSPPFLIS
jgi:hypothetical protein